MMKPNRQQFYWARLFIVFACLAGSVAADEAAPPRLILQITVDQLRGDLPKRFLDRYGEGGLRYLLEEGAVYENAQYQHSNLETIVGHVTLATGAQPSSHGMVANVWVDRETGVLGYAVEDPDYTMLGAQGGVDKDTEIDPTQAAATSDGRSPRAILTSTFSDELAVATAGRAKVFGVSVKDRGAIAMAGHAGKAFWFSKKTGEFVSSTYYYDEYPDWVSQWNAEHLADGYQGKSWELLQDADAYVYRDTDDRPYETALPGFGRVFPHPFGTTEDKLYYTLLTLSPVGDDLTLEFAKALMLAEDLGKDAIPDYLSVSFSSTDYVGHMFGVASLESEDNILRLDRTVAELLRFVDEQVGLENTLIVLSADHGAPEAPEYMASFGMNVGRLVPSTFDEEPAIEALKQRFGIGRDLINMYKHPYIYLDHQVIRENDLDPAEVERALAEELMKVDGVALAVSSSDLRAGRVPEDPVVEQVRRNFHPKRSGDIYLVQEPYWFLYSDESTPLCTIHGSPWKYDTYVPIIFAGYDIPARTISRRVHPVDIAATLAACAGAKPPSSCEGMPLSEVLVRASGEEHAEDLTTESLDGTEWLVEDIGGKGVIDMAQTTVEFSEEDRVSGSTGCNTYRASSEIEGGQISFGPMASTMMACPDALMDQEQRFTAAMSTVRSYEVAHDGAILYFLDENGVKILRMSKKEEQ
jgi:heat shock protein HslJ